MFRLSLSFRSIIILPDNFKTVSTKPAICLLVQSPSVQTDPNWACWFTSRPLRATVSLSQPAFGAERWGMSSLLPARRFTPQQSHSPLTGTFSTHCHSALLYMAHCTVTTSVLHKTLYCTRYTDPCKRGDRLGRPTLTAKPTPAHAAREQLAGTSTLVHCWAIVMSIIIIIIIIINPVVVGATGITHTVPEQQTRKTRK